MTVRNMLCMMAVLLSMGGAIYALTSTDVNALKKQALTAIERGDSDSMSTASKIIKQLEDAGRKSDAKDLEIKKMHREKNAIVAKNKKLAKKDSEQQQSRQEDRQSSESSERREEIEARYESQEMGKDERITKLSEDLKNERAESTSINSTMEKLKIEAQAAEKENEALKNQIQVALAKNEENTKKYNEGLKIKQQNYDNMLTGMQASYEEAQKNEKKAWDESFKSLNLSSENEKDTALSKALQNLKNGQYASSQLKHDLEAQKNTIQTLNSTINDLNAAQLESEKKIEEIKKQSADCATRILTLKDESSSAKQQLTTAKQAIETTQRDSDKYQASKKNYENKYNEAINSIIGHEKENGELKAENDSLDSKYEMLKTRVVALATTLETIENAGEQLKKLYSRWQKSNKDTKTDNLLITKLDIEEICSEMNAAIMAIDKNKEIYTSALQTVQ